MIITSIKQQKRQDRVSVYLDNEFGFGIDMINFVLLNLKIGQELAEDEVKEIVKRAEFQKILDKLFKFCMIRPRSQKEIRDYFQRKKIAEILWEDLTLKLKEFHLLDEEKFAKWWVEVRLDFSPKSRRTLKNELKSKGIKQDIIEKILAGKKIDELQIAQGLLKKRSLHWRNIVEEKRCQKMLIYLVGKGFDFELARKAVKAYNTREDKQVKD